MMLCRGIFIHWVWTALFLVGSGRHFHSVDALITGWGFSPAANGTTRDVKQRSRTASSRKVTLHASKKDSLIIPLESSSSSSSTNSLSPSSFSEQLQQPHQPTKTTLSEQDRPRRQYYGRTALRDATVRQGRVPYGEESRKYRRTVYTETDWVEHRRSDRILSNLKGVFYSGIVRQIQHQVTLVAAAATVMVALHQFHALELNIPSLPFQLSSPALGLLLVFRTNSSFGRWSQACSAWSRVVSNSRNMVRMAATFTDVTISVSKAKDGEKRNEDATDDPVSNNNDYVRDDNLQTIRHLSQATWLLARSLMNQFLPRHEDEDLYCQEVRATITDRKLVKRILQAPDRASAALMEVSLALDRVPIDEKRRVEIDKSIVLLGDCLATCEGIYRNPVPLVYTRHTSRFLSLFLLLLPLALLEPSGGAIVGADGSWALWHDFAIVPAVTLVSIFLFGIAELAVQLEEPFSILPLQQFCDEVRDSCNSLIEWREARLQDEDG